MKISTKNHNVLSGVEIKKTVCLYYVHCSLPKKGQHANQIFCG